MLAHLKERKEEKKPADALYDRVEVASAVEMSPVGFDSTPRMDPEAGTGHGDGGDKRTSATPRAYESDRFMGDVESPRVKLEDGEEEEDKDEDAAQQQHHHHDSRFRVNGIVVDSEVKGGAKEGWEYVYQIMFRSSTPVGQRVALVMLVMVSMSVVVAVLDSVNDIRDDIGDYLFALEAFFTALFSVEYVLRVLCLRQPRKFLLSLLGFIDVCALVPAYLGLFIPEGRPLLHLAVLRIFRVLRVFRVLRLARFVDAGAALSDNIQSNKRRIAVFLVALATMILVIGCAMYLIEGDRNEFSNIPISLYWTVVTMTTVGYGDIAPQTILGRLLATLVMFVGYGIIACPLVLNQVGTQDILTEVIECPRCFRRLHQGDANFCRVCGTSLRQPRAKSLKARRDQRLRLAKLRLPMPDELPSSTTSTARSSMGLLADEPDSMRARAQNVSAA